MKCKCGGTLLLIADQPVLYTIEDMGGYYDPGECVDEEYGDPLWHQKNSYQMH